MKDKNHQWQLMAKKVAGKASEEECKALQLILNENPVLVTLMNTLTDFSNTVTDAGNMPLHNYRESNRPFVQGEK